MHARTVTGVALAATLLAALFKVSAAAAATPEQDLIAAGSSGVATKLGPWLANVHEEYQGSSNKRAFRSRNSAMRVQGGLISLDLYANDGASLQRSLTALGARNIKSHGPLVSAQVPVSALGQLAALPALRFAIPSLARVRVASQGDVVSQGDVSLGSNTVRATTGLDGAGVTVGVMSDSYQCNPAPFVPGAPTTTAAQDEATQDVPPGVEVLDNGPCPGSDEGRGMVQLVHDVAPGAAQKFHTAFNSLVDFADGILELQEAGSDVIVDDVIYFAENMFSDGIIAQAADLAVARGAAYFSSAGNQARQSYESTYRETTVSINGGGNNNGNGAPFVLPVHDFDPGAGTDTLQKVHVTPDAGGQALVIFSLQWDQPFLSSTAYAQATDPNGAAPRGATGDLDMLIYTDKGVLVPRCPPGVSTGITCQLAGTRNVGGDAVDLTLLFVGGLEMPFLPEGMPRRIEGRAEFIAFVTAGREALPVTFVEFRDLVIHETTDPEVIVAEFEYQGTVAETGEEFALPGIFVMRVRDGEIVSSRDYFDHLTAARIRSGAAERSGSHPD
jgi:ketosteroid isomerase-like protein